jgi:ectoine hydroxylase-related dioxygenase (phytanoyl-CoA dioxygenase family)
VTSTTVDALLKPEGPLGIIARALLKPKSGMFLFNDQYIVKPPFSATARFDWHRDSQWCVAEPKGSAAPKETRDVSYVSLWTALDDVDETNGCVRVMPYPSARVEWTGRRGARDSIAANRREGTAGRYEHAPNRLNELAVARWSSSRSEREKEEMTRAFANVRAMRVRAGSILCLSDEVLHCSGPNASSAARRAWMPQFSKGEVLNADAQPVAMAVPVNDA